MLLQLLRLPPPLRCNMPLTVAHTPSAERVAAAVPQLLRLPPLRHPHTCHCCYRSFPTIMLPSLCHDCCF
jgi:hypothetical protein